MGKLISMNDLSIRVSNDDFLSLTDMLKNFPNKVMIDWLRNKSTLEFIEAWEKRYNPNFNCGIFAIIKEQPGKVSVKQLKECNIICIRSSAGRYGDTKGHKDIALEFAQWLDIDFKLWVNSEFQRMKELEREGFAKAQYNAFIRKDVATEYGRMNKALEDMRIYQDKETLFYHYTNEANLLNRLITGLTSKECKELHGDIPRNVFTDKAEYFFELEMMNTSLLRQGLDFDTRKQILSDLLNKLPVIVGKKQKLLLSNKSK